MLIHMKLSSKATLAAAALCMAACTLGPGDNPKPEAGASGAEDVTVPGDRNGSADTDEDIPGTANNRLIKRLRLPDMTELPTDSELTTNKPKGVGGGVIARPPSE